MSVASTSTLEVQQHDGLARLILNRPDSLNAMNESMMDELLDVLVELDRDPAVRAVLLSGAGRAFSAGGDVKMLNARSGNSTEFGSTGSTIERRRADLVRRGQATVLLQNLSKPVVVALHGHVVGGALALALACDLRIAADDIKLRIGFAARGLSGDYGIGYLLSEGLGAFRARALMLLDEPLDAERALGEGLVTRVVPRAELEDAAIELATRLAQGPTIAYGRTKANLAAAAGSATLAQYIETEAINQRISALTADCAESGRAFVERRAPRFTGE
jgi:2-(1,2-epoxy-1,2-dihydrophenyl)acetyl-CoA isomerase